MIPKTIHYCWFGGKPLPREVKKCIESWRRFCPDYEVVCWNESNFDVHQHPFCHAAFKDEAWAFVSDYARLKLVYDYGGIYLDTDVELLQTLDSLLENQCYVGIQQMGRQCATGLGFGAVQGSAVVQAMLREYDSVQYDSTCKRDIACPYLNNKALRGMGYSYSDEIVRLDGVTVYPCRYFDPIAPGATSEDLLCSETISIHCYTNSWGSPVDRIRRKLLCALNPRRVGAIKKILYRKS